MGHGDYSSRAAHLDWALSDPFSHKMRRAMQQSTVPCGSAYLVLGLSRSERHLLITSSGGPDCLCPLLQGFSPQLISMASRETFQDKLTEEQKLRSGFEHILDI